MSTVLHSPINSSILNDRGFLLNCTISVPYKQNIIETMGNFYSESGEWRSRVAKENWFWQDFVASTRLDCTCRHNSQELQIMMSWFKQQKENLIKGSKVYRKVLCDTIKGKVLATEIAVMIISWICSLKNYKWVESPIKIKPMLVFLLF